MEILTRTLVEAIIQEEDHEMTVDRVEWAAVDALAEAAVVAVVEILVAETHSDGMLKQEEIPEKKNNYLSFKFNVFRDDRGSSDRRGRPGSSAGGGDRFSSSRNQQQQQPGEHLRRVKWEDYSLIPFQKNFYSPCESVLLRTPQEIERFQRKNEITTKGRDVPPPLLEFYEGKFPDYAMREIAKCGFEKPTAIQAQGMFARIFNQTNSMQ